VITDYMKKAFKTKERMPVMTTPIIHFISCLTSSMSCLVARFSFTTEIRASAWALACLSVSPASVSLLAYAKVSNMGGV